MKFLIIGLWKPDVKTNCYCICENCPIWEPDESLKKLNFLIPWSILTNPKFNLFLKNSGSDSKNHTRKLELKPMVLTGQTR